MATDASGVKTRAHEAAAEADPYLWLEDVQGEKSMEWVRAQNVRSTATLRADPEYQPDYDAILKVMDAVDRIPYGDLDHRYVFNFWQDAQHPKGIWRRTDIADYATSTPAWEVLPRSTRTGSGREPTAPPRSNAVSCTSRAAAAMQ